MAIITQPLAISYIHNCNAFSFSSTQAEWVELKRDGVSFFNEQVTPVADVVSVNMIDELLASFTTSGHVVNNIVVTEAEATISIITQEFGTIQFTAKTGVVGTGASITVEQQPDYYNFAFDCKDLIINTDLETIISFHQNGVLFLEEQYFPFEGKITIKLKDILTELLYPMVPNSTLFDQTTQISMFSIILPTETITFEAIAGGRNMISNPVNFMLQNLLTNRPQISILDKKCPLIFTFAKLRQEALVQLHIYNHWDGDYDDWVVSLPPIQTGPDEFSIHTVNYTYDQLIALINENYEYDATNITHVDVIIRHSTDVQDVYEYSNPFRFIFSRQSLPTDDVFLFENVLGSIEAITFDGDLEQIQNHKSTAYKFDDVTHEFRNEYIRTFKKSTGYFKTEELRLWASEFFSSKKRYHLVNGVAKEIYLNSMDAKSMLHEINDYSFDFAYSEDSRYRSVDRASSLPAL